MPPRQKKKDNSTEGDHPAPAQRKTRSSKITEVPAESPQLEAQQTGKGKPNEKRKARPSFPDQPGKRVNAGIPPESRGDTNANSVQDRGSQPKTVTLEKSHPNNKAQTRTAPTRPPENSDSDSFPDDEGEASGWNELESIENDGATSPTPSEDDTEEPVALSATQLAIEYPVSVNTNVELPPAKRAGDDARGSVVTRKTTSKRVEQIIGEVPVPSRSPADAPDTPTTATAVQQPAQAVPVPTPVLPPGLPAHPHHVPTWTDLVQEEDGAYKQTSQHPELNTCLSATIKRANTNLVVFDAFPSLHIRYTWLLDSLRLEFAIRRDRSLFINAVAERADVDENYLNCLISMVNGRWSSFRQGVIQAARERIRSKDCSYAVRGSGPEVATNALVLLEKDSFHYGRTSAGALDRSAPYQHQEVLITLGYFFKGNDSLKDRLPTGIHGAQIPEPMAALVATALEVALREVARGMQLVFSEKKQRERYLPYLKIFNDVKVSSEGARKLARLLSDIYKGTMRAIDGELAVATPAAPAESLLDTDSMPV